MSTTTRPLILSNLPLESGTPQTMEKACADSLYMIVSLQETLNKLTLASKLNQFISLSLHISSELSLDSGLMFSPANREKCQ